MTVTASLTRACSGGIPMRNRHVCRALSGQQDCHECGKLAPSPLCYGTFRVSKVCDIACELRTACRREQPELQPDGQVVLTIGKGRPLCLATPLDVTLTSPLLDAPA